MSARQPGEGTAPTAAYRRTAVRRWHPQQPAAAPLSEPLAQEAAVALVYNGISHVVMMASPDALEDLALGFSLSEGIVRSTDDIYAVEAHRHPPGHAVNIRISAACMAQLKQRRRNLTGRTGCGLCGTESLEQAVRAPIPVGPACKPSAAAVQQALATLAGAQPLQALTGACHGAAWCDMQGKIHLLREDIGRHNALDKLIGALANTVIDRHQGFALVSSRASYEMVQKATSAGITALVAVSAATALAVELARASGLHLIGFARQGRHTIYTN
ncbi:formate dehydrogenase accessory sulfurtransferase FdhD [Exilibacterium tricleocarpae]|uniref:Sulfur carrier protein FdhD n=1 Tax=Exilibacterium tricleocarpae TaxID=2591008 RepID=A0A545SS55_9GAMM|nr:formate dehydrogenase accessory sulfurtransferase FdhD [Exilibacterium tricleocarpae]TQV67785.1 formate dehydrogenase accessory sulfurtransferase FdhD [Exilibacterium tricleocarpae]